MEHSPSFLKLRLAMFSLTTLICFIWVILLSCVLFLRWDVSSPSERSFLFIFLGIDTLTVIMLPILLIAEFRSWLDGARLLLLLVYHIGMATSFTTWNPTISCPDNTPDSRGVCQLLNVYIIIASWVPPLLLIAYGVGLATYTWRYASRPRAEAQFSADEETGDVQPGEPVAESRNSSSARGLIAISSVPSTDARDSRRESERRSRLEKRLPEYIF